MRSSPFKVTIRVRRTAHGGGSVMVKYQDYRESPPVTAILMWQFGFMSNAKAFAAALRRSGGWLASANIDADYLANT